MKTTRNTLPEHIVTYIEECMAREHPESYLISVLQRVQREYGYLSRENMDEVSVLMNIPSTKVSGAASFYHFFSFVPKGRHTITVCMGTACFVRGADRILERLKEILGAETGQTTEDGRFTLEAARCIGACALAPVMVVDGKVYGNVAVGDLQKILADYP